MIEEIVLSDDKVPGYAHINVNPMGGGGKLGLGRGFEKKGEENQSNAHGWG